MPMADSSASIADALERILPGVVRPARYSGNEWTRVLKDWPGRLHVALAYPDVYEESVCDPWTLGVYQSLNAGEDMLCERAYVPWPDMDQALRQAGLPLYTLESKRPLAAFDLLLIVLPDELHFPAALTLLDLAGLALHADDRRGAASSQPLVIGIGPGTANSEPLAEFFDGFIIGEIDAQIVRSCPDALRLGSMAAVEPVHPIVMAAQDTLPAPLSRPIVPFAEARRERAVVELSHPPLYPWTERPALERPVDEVLGTVEAVLAATGYDHVLLSGEHSCLEEIVSSLSSRYAGRHLHFMYDPLTTTVRSVDLADRLPRLAHGALAVDLVASERLRSVHGSMQSDEEILAAVRLAFQRGWHIIKLHAMLGLPGETEADVHNLAALARRMRDMGREEIDGRAQVLMTVEPFIPRAHSRWERDGLPAGEAWQSTVAQLAKGVRGPGLRLTWQGLETRLVQAALARGDRRLGRVIEYAWRGGMRRPEDSGDVAGWQAAFASAGLDIG